MRPQFHRQSLSSCLSGFINLLGGLDTGVLGMHRDHCDTWRNDSDSSGGGEKPLETASTQVCRGFHTENVNTPASHFLCHVSCSGSTYFLTPDSYHANLAGQVKMLNLLCVTVTINTGHRRMEDMTDGWRSDMIHLEWWQVLLVSVQWIYWLAAGSVNGPCNEHQSSLDSWNTFRLSIWNCVSCVSEGVAHSSVRLSFVSSLEVINERYSIEFNPNSGHYAHATLRSAGAFLVVHSPNWGFFHLCKIKGWKVPSTLCQCSSWFWSTRRDINS